MKTELRVMGRTTTHAVLAAILVAACVDEPLSPVRQAIKPKTAVSVRDLSRSSWPTIIDQFATIARSDSTFAGLYLDATRSPVVLLTDVSHIASVRSAGVDAMLSERAIAGGVRAVQAEYSFRALKQWYDSSQNFVWALGGIVFTAIDPEHNKLHFAVRDVSAQERILTKLTQLGIPNDAIAFEVHAPFVDASGISAASHMAAADSLVDTIRPLKGGTKIVWSGVGSAGWCTLTVPGHTQGSSPDSQFFFTASHCGAYATMDSRKWYQPDSLHSDSIGTEIKDPAQFQYPTGTCPGYTHDVFYWPYYVTDPSYTCRNADVAKILVRSGVSTTPGVIAHTNYHTLALVAPSFYDTSEAASPIQGTTVYKTGASDGQSSGAVTNVCVNVPRDPTDTLVLVLCGTEVSDTASHSGDSGAPVYEWSGSDSEVAFVGILAQRDNFDANYIFYPVGNMHADLGAFDVRSFPPLHVSLSGPGTIETPGAYTYTATASGGTGSYTYRWYLGNFREGSGSSQTDTMDTTGYWHRPGWGPGWFIGMTDGHTYAPYWAWNTPGPWNPPEYSHYDATQAAKFMYVGVDTIKNVPIATGLSAISPPYSVSVIVTSASLHDSLAMEVDWNPVSSVSISGPHIMGQYISCTWYASPTGGTAPYTYEWDVYGNGDTNPVQTGSSDGFSYVNTGTGFSISVTVTDSYGTQASNSFGVSGTGYSCGS